MAGWLHNFVHGEARMSKSMMTKAESANFDNETAEQRLERVEALWAADHKQQLEKLSLASAETQQLRETINALRDAMEQARIGEQERIQAAAMSANDEVRQLKAMVDALRDELERRAAGEAERTQRALAVANAECLQLKGSVNALRDEMESQRRHYLDEAAKTESQYQRELSQLRQTIQDLRLKLESGHV